MASTKKLEAESFQRLHPRAYLERFLAEGIRPDGREDRGWRNVSINAGSISTADGSALVRIGDTTVVCGIKAEVAEPALERPNDGYIVPNVDLPAICSPKFKPGPPGEEAQVLSEQLYDALTASGVILPSSLCIEPGKAVWVLYIDATCINYDGNAFDATLLAMVSALQNTRLRHLTFSAETGLVSASRTIKNRLKLDSSRIPLSFSFGSFPGSANSTHVLSDYTSFEEPLLLSTLTIILYPTGEIGGISQTGLMGRNIVGTAQEKLESATLLCIRAAKERLPVLKHVMESQFT